MKNSLENSVQDKDGFGTRVARGLGLVGAALLFISTSGNAFAAKAGAKSGGKAAASDLKFVDKPSSYEKFPTAKKGGTLTVDIGSNPKVMNWVLRTDDTSFQVEEYLWVPLMTTDLETLEPVQGLATSYEISPDRKNYKFFLNKDAVWEDGTPVTADDIKFTFDKLMDPKVEAAAKRSYYEGVTCVVNDPLTVTFSINEPKFDTLEFLYSFVPMQKKQFENEPDYNKAKGILNPIGNGAFKLTKFSRDQRIEFERKKDWWGNKVKSLANQYNFDKVVMRIITDQGLVYENFVKGNIDVMAFAGPGLETYANKVLGTDKDKFGKKPSDGKDLIAVENANKAARGHGYIGWNLQKPMFSSVKTRRALAQLLDMQTIINKVYYGYTYQATSPFGSLTMYSDPELRKPGKMLTYDVKKAIQLLKEDGWADTDKDGVIDKTVNGQKVPFKFSVKFNSGNGARGKVAQIMKENFKQAGIEVEIRSVEWNAFLSDVQKKEFDAVVLAWTGSSFPNAKQIWHSDSSKDQGSNYVSYSNKKVDELIEKSNLEFNLAKRAKIMQEINRIIYEDQPYLFLSEPKALLMGVNKRVSAPKWSLEYDPAPSTAIYHTVQ